MSKITTKLNLASSEDSPLSIIPSVEDYPLSFHEWSDADICMEKWDAGKINTTVKKDSKRKLSSSNALPIFPPQYQDPDQILLPPCFQGDCWVRPDEYFEDAQLMVYFPGKPNPESLIQNSQSLLASELVRSFISTVYLLQYMSEKSMFAPKSEGGYFCNTMGQIWRPWHHVYSNCKAGRTATHNPTVNKMGKYIVRLYWMGCWRKIYVDDRLALDKDEAIMFPSTKNRPRTMEDKKDRDDDGSVELWPYLLFKAILKLVSLSWNSKNEMIDFDMFHIFTGWIPHKISTRNLRLNDIWEICSMYATKYVWPEDQQEAESKQNRKSESCEELADSYLFHLFATCNDLRNPEISISDLTPCDSHTFLICQTRDIPLIKPAERPEVTPWKKFRWVSWAVENGLHPPEEEMDTTKYFKIVSCFRKYFKPEDIMFPLTKDQKQHEVLIQRSQQIFLPSSQYSKYISSDESLEQESDETSTYTTISETDVTTWINFEEVGPELESITIYFKSQAFKNKVRISNLPKPERPANRLQEKSSLVWSYIHYPTDAYEESHAPLYIFLESIDTKFVLVNLTQEGQKLCLVPPIQEESEKPSTKPSKVFENEMLSTMIERVKAFSLKDGMSMDFSKHSDDTDYDLQKEAFNVFVDFPEVKSSVSIEEFDWQKDRCKELLCYLCSRGNKSTALEIPPGRKVLRLWIKPHSYFILNILSDSHLLIGGLEVILQALCEESHLFSKLCIDVAVSFGKLIMALGTESYLEAARNFFKSYKPPHELDKNSCSKIHQTFFDLLIQAIKAISDIDLHPSIVEILTVIYGYIKTVPSYVKSMRESLHLEITSGEIMILKYFENSAATIQAGYRGFHVRKKVKKILAETELGNSRHILKKIYEEIFSAERRMLTTPKMMRALLSSPAVKPIAHLYGLENELNNVIYKREFLGTSSMAANNWLTVCRYVFYVNSRSPVVVRINFFCEIRRSVVRVISNDTLEEHFRFFNKLVLGTYVSNVHGYTVLCYCFSEVTKNINWSLVFSSVKSANDPIIEVPDAEIKTLSFKENYIPSVTNLVCKYVIEIFRDSFLSMRLSTCEGNVRLQIRITNDKGKIVHESISPGNTIIPVVLLKCRHKATMFRLSNLLLEKKKDKSMLKVNSSKTFDKPLKRRSTNSSLSLKEEEIEKVDSTFYYLEVYILDNSWKLTRREWRTVLDLKKKLFSVFPENVEVKDGIKGDEIVRRSSSRLSKSEGIERPYWNLQLVCNINDSLQLHRDRSQELQFKSIKKSWYEEDPTRYKRSKEIRMKYLSKYLTKSSITMTKNIESWFENDDDNEKLAVAPSIIKAALPPYDLSAYYKKPGEAVDPDDVVLKKSNDFLEDIDKVIEKEEEFQHYQINFQEQYDKLSSQQAGTSELFELWRQESKLYSEELLRAAYQLRENYLIKMGMAPSQELSKESTTSGNDKEKKKKKK